MADATDKPRISYVTIATLRNRAEARPIVAILAAAGIRCLLTDESEAVADGLGRRRQVEVKVQVKRQDISRALELLHNLARAGDSAEGKPRRIVDLGIISWQRLALAVGAVIGTAGLLALLL